MNTDEGLRSKHLLIGYHQNIKILYIMLVAASNQRPAALPKRQAVLA